MSLQVEKLEKNMAKLTIEVSADEFEKAIHRAYLKNKGKINIQGFRKGKVPQAVVERMYGSQVFYEDAANDVIPTAYREEVKKTDLIIVSQPKIDVTQMEKGKEFIFTAEVALKPEVTVGNYKGVEVEKIAVEVTEEEINQELEQVRNQNGRTISIEDRAVQKDDMTVIDFEGFVDGEPFQGGKGEDYDLVIGSGAFIPGFEDQLIGVEIGKETEIQVTFPEQYHAPELAGKPAIFKVTVKEIKIKELPELDDEFAKDVSDFDTLEEYKADIKAKLLEKKEDDAYDQKENKVIEKIIEDSQMEIPDAMIDYQARGMMDDFARNLQMQGLSVEQYFQFTGLTAQKMIEDMRPNALKKIQSRLVLEKIVELENITATQEDIDQEIADAAAAYSMEADKLREFMGEAEMEQMKVDIAVQKAADLVVEASKEIEVVEADVVES